MRVLERLERQELAMKFFHGSEQICYASLYHSLSHFMQEELFPCHYSFSFVVCRQSVFMLTYIPTHIQLQKVFFQLLSPTQQIYIKLSPVSLMHLHSDFLARKERVETFGNYQTPLKSAR